MEKEFTERDMEDAFEAGEVNRNIAGYQKQSSSSWVANRRKLIVERQKVSISTKDRDDGFDNRCIYLKDDPEY